MEDRPAFPGILERFRNGRLTRKDLAQQIGLSPAMITLFLSGERRPNRNQTLRMAAALGLEPAETDELLMAAGHLPAVYDRTPPTDYDLMLVASILGDSQIPDRAKERFRLAIRLAGLDWRPDALELGALHGQLVGHPDRGQAAEAEGGKED